jgi:hypothetical protein
MAYAYASAFATASARQAAANVNWTVNGGEGNIRYSPLTQINRTIGDITTV